MSSATNIFQTLALIGNDRDTRVVESMQVLATHLHSRGCRIMVDAGCSVDFGKLAVERHPEDQLAHLADLLVAIGGDGTMLHAARLASPRATPVVGVNRGRLGFLADIGIAEMRERLDEVLAGHHVRDRRAMLQATLLPPGAAAPLPSDPGASSLGGHALNDVVLQKWETGRMLDFETWIDGRYVNTHGGDGIVVATATGSTAYALSCGGPILYPELDAVVLAPICPHTLSDRPIVVRGTSTVELRLLARADTQAQVLCDGIALGELSPGGRLVIQPAPEHVMLLHPADHDYYRILRSKLRWGRGDRATEQLPD